MSSNPDFSVQNHGIDFSAKTAHTFGTLLGRRAHRPGQRIPALFPHGRSRAPLYRRHRCRNSERWIGGAAMN